METWCFCEVGTELLDSGFKIWIILIVVIFADLETVLQNGGVHEERLTGYKIFISH